MTEMHTLREKFTDKPIPRPPYWGGYQLTPQNIEFWIQRPHRMHERVIYMRDGDSWTTQRLYP